MSAVEWKSLSEVFEMRGGYTPSTKNDEFWEDGILPWFRMEDIREKGNILSDSTLHITPIALKKNGLFPQNSIILATSATIGVHALLTVPALSNQRFTAFYPKEEYEDKINYKFTYYVFYLIDEWCKNNIVQGGFASVDMTGLKKYLIPIPSLAKQQEIVSHLDTFTTLISNLESELDMRRKQYEHYRNQLLDFEGVEGVEWKTLGETCTLKARIGWQGLTKKEYREKGDYLLVTGTDFTDAHTIDFEHCVYVDRDRYEQDVNIQLKSGDVLITKDGTLGKVAYINSLPKPTTLNGGVFVVRDTTSKISQKYLMYYLVSGYFRHFIEHNHTNGTIKHLTQGLLVNFTIPVPSKQTQREIVEKLDAFENLIQSLEQEIKLRKQQYEYYREKLLTFEKE